MDKHAPNLPARCVAELIGTFLLVFFGCGAVHAAVITGAQSGLWQVAIVWGVAIMIAVYVTGAVSGAHINPAITVALWAWRGFPGHLVVPYIVSQVAGAMLAAATLFLFFGPLIEQKEKSLGVTRGVAGSEMTAMCYGEYYPNPGRMADPWKGYFDAAKDQGWIETSPPRIREDHYALVSETVAFLAEVLGTLILALAVFAVTDERNAEAPAANLAPVFIGLTVAILISVIAPLTQACFNPARDFGPRVVAFFAGWGEIALPGPNGRGFLTVYIVAPCLGALAGGGLYQKVIRPNFPEAST
ncbi:MAG: aquaporin [Gemmataceae bacterium]|nr:aquaporin [Gemmataceae bacterium]MCI0743683.1 aquaporin [Gemmataceae bacterium]